MRDEQAAREEIERTLTATGWAVCDAAKANIHAARGVAIREFPLRPSHGFADYLLYVDGTAAGVIETFDIIVTDLRMAEKLNAQGQGVTTS